MSRPETEGFRKPLKPVNTKAVGLARVTMGSTHDRKFAECTCGWVGWHSRLKVLDDRIDAHITKKHKGRGFRL